MTGTACTGSAAFQRLAQNVGCSVADSAQASFELVFEDDLAITVSLHPNGDEVAADIWCCDAALLTGAPRRTVIKALLLLNQAIQSGRPLSIGIDSRDFILLHGRQALAQLDGPAFTEWLIWLADQGRRVRALIRTLSFESAEEAPRTAGHAAPFPRMDFTSPSTL